MEPIKALTLIVAAAIVSLVGAGAAGFYAGYSAGRGNLDEIKAHISSAQAVIPTGDGGSVSLKPVLDNLHALSKQVESLAAVKASSASDDSGSKPVLDEIKALASQVDSLKAAPAQAPLGAAEKSASAAAPDYTEALHEIREQVRALNVKFEKQEPKAPKALIDEIRALAASVQAQEPNARRAMAEELRSAVATLQNTEPKAPKALVEELRTLNTSIHAQEANARRAMTEEIRSAVAVLQNAEPKVSKALMDEIRTISANVRPAEGRTQASVVDQIKVLQATLDSLKAKLAEDRGRGDTSASADAAQLRQLIASASDQFSKCQTQLAAFASAGASPQPAAQTAAAISVSQGARQEPSAVVFYDNVMLKKDQEKQYDEIGVRLSLQSIGPRQVRVAVNRQGFGLSFGERKVFRSQDVECEINLMETSLNDSQARISISCKR